MLMNLLLDGFIYALIGLFAGLMAGILGVGGGIIVVPGLVFIFQLRQLIPEQIVMHVAAGTSLAVMIFTAQASIRAHYKMGAILWSVFNKLWPGIAMGTVSGAVLAGFISTYWLKIIFAIFLLFVSQFNLNLFIYCMRFFFLVVSIIFSSDEMHNNIEK